MSDYRPEADGLPDPGEVCWAWVPYEDDPAQGKDRPVLVIAETRDGTGAVVLDCLVLTSQDHDRDAEQEAAAGRHWMDVGSGGWDSSGRPSEVRLDRLVRIGAEEIRREGAALDPQLFAAVIEARAAYAV